MAKFKEVFVCQTCGASAPKWQGQCAACGEWNTLLAETQPSPHSAAKAGRVPPGRDASFSLAAEAVLETPRLATGSAELDRVLGGGLVPGSVTLIGGDPGIGKSTLMLQAAAALNSAGPVLYATGEESLKQVALRARRLGLESAAARLIAETQVEQIVAAASSPQGARAHRRFDPDDVFGAHRGRARRRIAAARMHRRIGPLRQGAAAPRYCWWVMSPRRARSPDRACSSTWSIRCCISRATPAAASGCCVRSRTASAPPMRSACSPWWSRDCARSPTLLRSFSRGTPSPLPGSVVTVMREGTRSLLIEVQVLADVSLGANPRRVAVGIDGNRLTMLLAVAHRHGGLLLQDQDVFANVVGGVRLAETAGDLAIVLAARSSLRDLPLAPFADRVRRIGPRGRDPTRAVRRGAPARGGQARIQAGAGAGSERAEASARGHDGARRDTPESGARCVLKRLCFVTAAGGDGVGSAGPGALQRRDDVRPAGGHGRL